MIIYSKLLAGKYAGRSYGFFIAINPHYKDDTALIAHEKKHVKQFWSCFPLMPFRYYLSRKWRCAYEVEAYKVSVENGMPVDQAAYHLSTLYDLGLTQFGAKALLEQA